MSDKLVFYLCPKCFELREDAPGEHPHGMIRVDSSELDEELRRPLFDEQGRLLTQAPKWFLQALDSLRRGGS